MKTYLKGSIAVFAFFILSFYANAQLITWNTAPEKGFVFEISNKEAQKLLTCRYPDSLFKKMLHTLIDTFDTKKGWVNRPEKGHFILAHIKENKLHCDYTCMYPYQVFLLKEYDGLTIQVLDTDGKVREDAKVKFRFRRLSFDRDTKMYREENDWFRSRHKIVTVELHGFRSVFDITKNDVPSWYNNYNYSSPGIYSYMITDKNKYKPGDKVRFKSYALTGNRAPFRNTLEIRLTDYRKNWKMGTVDPHRPGSFAGEFMLHDSLKLTLDKTYYIQLLGKNGRLVSSCTFKYEDYELTGNKLDLKLSDKQFYPESNYLKITATDVNGLMMKDARAEILVTTETINETFETAVVLHDTLFFKKMDLDPEDPIEIEISPEWFQKSNTSYNVSVTVLNSQNHRMEALKTANFIYSQYELKNRFSNDSICFDLYMNNQLLNGVPAKFWHNNNPEAKDIILPYKEKLNAATTLIKIENKFVTKQITMCHLVPELKLTGGIKKDSFCIKLDNPQKLDVSWFIYRGSMLLKKGFGKEFQYDSIIEDRSLTYYVELLYSFGGRDHIIKKQYEFREDFLDVSLDLPDRVYPGQKTEATVSVKNQLGEPVRNVDLTAFAVTAKLNYDLPDLPYYGSKSSARPKKATYSKRDVNSMSAVLNLDYPKWEKMAGLDTMKYYQLTYPKNKFKCEISINDSTQFAPYIMQNGRALQIYVIEVDQTPVYYSWTNIPSEYSFYISPGRKHEISLRLYDRVLVLDSISFEAGMKTIFSFDLDKLPGNIKVHKLPSYFTETEKNRHKKYICSFENAGGWLETEKEFIPLYSGGYIQAGPVIPGKKTYTEPYRKIRTSYNHTGGYRYAFEDNIVYKLTDTTLFPYWLYDKNFNPMSNINNLKITKSVYTATGNYTPVWNPRFINITDADSKINIKLPYDIENSGIAAILFEDCNTKQLQTPCFNNYYRNNFYNMPSGYTNIYVIYNSGKYYRADSLDLSNHITAVIDYTYSEVNPADGTSFELLRKYTYLTGNCTEDYREYYEVPYSYTYIRKASEGNVKGVIYDEANNPAPGVNIVVKGKQEGTVSDLDGRFSLNVTDATATLVFSYVGYKSEEIQVYPGTDVSFTLEPELMMLSEVVVVGYGVMRKSEITGAISMVNGENISEALEDETEEVTKEAEQKLYNELLNMKSIRSDFTDVGFWEPRLYTDKHGESKFTVTFPDDITRWDAVVYAMNRRLQTGTLRKSIKSYKPLVAELDVPRFLTIGDSAFFTGKVSNYTGDSLIQGKIRFNENEDSISFAGFYSGKYPFYVSGKDSVSSQFQFIRDDGYTDGEKRTIPVVEQGIIRADGTLFLLKNGEEKEIKTSENEQITIEILTNQIDIYRHEVYFLTNYRFLCNEQLASKLIGLINQKLLMQYEGKSFHYDYQVNKIIDKLLKNQNKEFLWSWWDVSENTSWWMSAHILRALKCAKDAGYLVDLDIDNIARKAGYKFNYLHNYSLLDIDLLNVLADWGAELNYKDHLQVFDSLIFEKEYIVDTLTGKLKYEYRYSLLNEKLLLQEIRQLTGNSYQRDSLLKYRKSGIIGEVYFWDKKQADYWYNDKMGANVTAYRIAKRDSALHDLLLPVQMYFLSTRKEQGWNTYQSSNVLMNVLPDLLAHGLKKGIVPGVRLSGKENRIIEEFPYKTTLQPGEMLNVSKKSGLPVYLMQYIHERVTEAKTGVEGFRIETNFGKDSIQLTAGKPVSFRVEVEITKDASFENVMIEVPIPASCSYADKQQIRNGVETHREYFKDQTVIFCENMKPGKYLFVIHLLPRFTGNYLVNPAQVSLMYVPVINANTEMKRVKVCE